MKKSRKLNKSKIKLIIIFLIIALLISIGILIILKLHSKENMKKRLLSGFDNLNYTYTTDNGKTTIKVFGKNAKAINSNYIKYIDYENKNVNEINPNATVEFRANYTNKGINEMDYYSKCISILDNESYSYKYIGKKDYNGHKCVVFKLSYNKGSYDTGMIYWVNDSLNVLEKKEYYSYKDNEIKIYDTKTFNFHTNSNKLEDVKIPDDILKYPTTIETGG